MEKLLDKAGERPRETQHRWARGAAFLPLLLLSLSASAHPFKLVVNEDNDHYFHLDRSQMTREALRAYVDTFATGGKVSHIFWTACGQPANYDSKAWEPVWERLDDPDYRKLDSTRKPGTPNWPENCKLLREQGIDPYAVWIERCRERGISPWLSMRMNDVHFTTHRRMQPGRTVRFWREHPELRRHPEWDPFDPAHREWKLFAFDYAKEEVRRYSLGMAKELIERYLPDGLELDWMRYVCHLTPGRERELAPVLTDFMREVRKIADAAGTKAGRRIALAVRIPSRYGYARDLGYDPETWAREGLCDLFVVCNKDSVDFGCDVADWARRLAPAAVIPGVDRFDCTHGERVYADLAGYRGWADAMYARGAQGLYLFNAIYLPEEVKGEIWAKGLGPAVTLSGPRRYVATYPDSAPDDIPEKSLCQLPRPLNAPVSLELFAGSGRTDGALSVVLAFDREIEASRVRLELNGIPSVGAPTELRGFGKLYGDPKLSKRVWRWTLPEKALRRDRNLLDIAALPGSEASVAWAEIATGAVAF